MKQETDDAPHEYLFWRSAPNAAVRWGKWKLWKVNNSDLDADEMGGGRLLPERDYPASSPLGQTTVLYDLTRDIGERTNLAEEYPEIVRQLEQKLNQWQSELQDPLWTSRRSTLHSLHGQTVQLFF